MRPSKLSKVDVRFIVGVDMPARKASSLFNISADYINKLKKYFKMFPTDLDCEDPFQKLKEHLNKLNKEERIKNKASHYWVEKVNKGIRRYLIVMRRYHTRKIKYTMLRIDFKDIQRMRKAA